MALPKSELLWTLDDFVAAGQEPPETLVGMPELCEGDLMSAEEVQEFIKDSIATLRILSDKASPRYRDVEGVFKADMLALHELGQIEEEEYLGLIDPENLSF